MKNILLIMASLFLMSTMACKNKNQENKADESKAFILENTINLTIDSLKAAFPDADLMLMERGIRQTARLWQESDGKADEFTRFCIDNYKADSTARKTLFLKLSRGFEMIWGNSIKMLLELREPTDMNIGEVEPIDEMFSAFDPQSHFTDDMYANKIAFITVLNFPSYTLEEKQKSGESWSRLEWAYARMGDVFVARVPAELNQQAAKAMADADGYISSYNIFMGKVLGKDKLTHFPADMALITHWNLRDELKSNYGTSEGNEKQEMIYAVMKRIIDQSIPEIVINDSNYTWDVYTNKVFQNGKEIKFTSEPSTRYQYLLDLFKSQKAFDPYFPDYPSYMDRRFNREMEIAQKDIEKLFVELLTSPQAKQVAELIKMKLGRDLRPYDIWYNGFRASSSLAEEELNKITAKKYPNPAALEKDLATILQKLKWSKEEAAFIASKIRVDGSRGAGHAWGAEMKSDKARLRTRIGVEGMNYKGYNIAVHEFGHNVEQTISLHNVDYYTMHGVPNTAFTEALAFIFQKRDLNLLNLEEKNPLKEHYEAINNFWACYEIMGVSLVDIQVWEWMYKNPDATAAELQAQVMTIAKSVWNTYYAPVFGCKDEPILAIYSHMIDNPLYLNAYPIGHLIDFQLEGQLQNKVFSSEVNRIFSQGRLAPQIWMKQAVGNELSVKPLLESTAKALEVVK